MRAPPAALMRGEGLFPVTCQPDGVPYYIAADRGSRLYSRLRGNDEE